MSNIGGLSSMTSSNIRGYGGLASGLDRDTLIENMTYGTTSKITQQQQKKMLLQWEQDAIRNISSKMIAFSDKYVTNLTSSSSLFSSAFWGRTDIKALGENSKYVSVSGRANAANPFEIARIKQLAEKAKWNSSSQVSNNVLETGKINTGKNEIDALKGKTLEFGFGDKTYSITLGGEDENGKAYRFDTPENITKSLNDIFKNVDVVADGKTQKLSDVISAEVTDGKLTFKNTQDISNIKLSGGSALSLLGFQPDPDKDFEEVEITKGGLTGEALDPAKLIKEVQFTELVGGKSLTFEYNGVSKSIKLPSEEEFKAGVDAGKTKFEVLKDSLQTQLNDAFGEGRIEVGSNGSRLTFKTTTPAGGTDSSSTLSIVGGDSGLLGKDGALGIEKGTSNKLNLDAKISEAGFKGFENFKGNFPVTFKINGTEIEIDKNDTVNDLLKKINENTNVTVSYQSATDKFTFAANAEGASGKIQFEFDENDANVKGVLEGIFGGNLPTTAVTGKDAIISVKYGDSDEEVEIIRDSNNFTLDGLTIGLKGTFGYDKDGNKIADTESITFEAKVNTDNVVENIKKMIEEYNEIIAIVTKAGNTRPDRSYQPLTSEQKKELTEEEIKLYEEKAKEGLLFNDNDIKSLSNDLRFILGSSNLEALKEIGISTSSSYSDNGKIEFDESKFRAALETDPEKVEALFTSKAETDENGNVISADGIAQNMKNVFEKYVKTLGATKGVLIERAGSEKAPASITKNALYNQMKEIDKVIAKLQNRLETERDRYIQQFTSLETIIAQMNSQSGWLSQFGGTV